MTRSLAYLLSRLQSELSLANLEAIMTEISNNEGAVCTTSHQGKKYAFTVEFHGWAIVSFTRPEETITEPFDIWELAT